jgi:hypothetical protein
MIKDCPAAARYGLAEVSMAGGLSIAAKRASLDDEKEQNGCSNMLWSQPG